MNLRVITLAAILGVAGIGTWLIAFARPAPARPAVVESAAEYKYVYLIDVAGWYEITPNESAVTSALDFSIENLKALPATIGDWTGAPIEIGPEINEWFENPDLALSSLYRDSHGRQAWFSIFGSKSRKSYFLFEHTPITSYPAAGWSIAQSGVVPMVMPTGRIHLQKATLTKGADRRVVFYWYLWNDFNREPENGVLTMRLHIPVVSTDDDAAAAGGDFLQSIFRVISWHRF